MPTIDPRRAAKPDPAARISAVFNASFAVPYRTVMEGGGPEPLYLPANAERPARIVFTHDYPASALHEAAHWCTAGVARRRRIDYGYAYRPPPRNAAATDEFCRLELKAQALERVFSNAVGLPFRVSLDDLEVCPARVAAFARAVLGESGRILDRGLVSRAARFEAALRREFCVPLVEQGR